MVLKSTNVLDRWDVEAPDVSEWISRHPMTAWVGWGIKGQPPTFEAFPPPPLLCRYLDAPREEVARRVPAGYEGEAYDAELRRQIEAATLCRAEISFSIERPPRGPKLIGVCRSIQILPPRDGGEIGHMPKIPVRDLIRRFVKDGLLGTPVEPSRRIGPDKRRQLLRVRDAYEAAPPRGKTAAVARTVLPHHTGDQLGAARQLIWEARAAGILPPATRRSTRDQVVGSPTFEAAIDDLPDVPPSSSARSGSWP
jgi:hypothetical protein